MPANQPTTNQLPDASQAAGLSKLAMRHHLTAESDPRIADSNLRPSLRKYPLVLLDEAVKLAERVGPADAAKATGVGVWSIYKHAKARRVQLGLPNKRHGRYARKYPPERVREAIAAVRAGYEQAMKEYNPRIHSQRPSMRKEIFAQADRYGINRPYLYRVFWGGNLPGDPPSGRAQGAAT